MTLFCAGLAARSYLYKVEILHHTTDLANFSGTCIFQDAEGFMWFGSTDGLYRYDGARFKAYHNDPFDAKSLSHEKVTCITEDRSGHLWLGTPFGLNRFDKSTGEFKSYTIVGPAVPGEGKDWGWNEIMSFIWGREGELWIATPKGLVMFDPATEAIAFHVLDSFNVDRSRAWQVMEDRSGILWLQNGQSGITRFDRETGSMTFIDKAPCDLNNFYEDRQGRFWITSYEGLYKFNPVSRTFERHLEWNGDPGRPKNQIFKNVLEDREGNYWISTYDGVYHYNSELEYLYSWKYSREFTRNWHYLDLSRSMYLDRAGAVWFFTDEGIVQIAKQPSNFNAYYADSTNYMINEILLDDQNNLWFSTLTEFYKLDRSTGRHTRLFLDPGNRTSSPRNFYFDGSGIFWATADYIGLYKGIPDHQGHYRFEFCAPVFRHSVAPNSATASSVFEDSRERIWINAWYGAPEYFDKGKNRVVHLIRDRSYTNGNYGRLFVTAETDSGDLLAAGYNGIYQIHTPLINISGDTVIASDVVRILPYQGDFFFEPVKIIRSSRSAVETLWIMTLRNGLVRYIHPDFNRKDYSGGNIKVYARKDGLPSNIVTSIQEDEKGRLWMGTKGGLSMLDPLTGVFTNYTAHDGLPVNAFRQGTSMSKDGEMFFGTDLGMVSFYPDSILKHDRVPPVALTEVYVNNESYSELVNAAKNRRIDRNGTAHLRYDQNNLSFEFAVLNYVEPKKNQFMHRLEGFQDDWVFAGNRSYAEYTNLKPGKYKFRVLGANNEGVWNRDGAGMSIRIHPPPWARWWSYLIYSFIVLSLILAYRNYLVRRARLQTSLEVARIEKEKVQEFDRVKSRFFANISHEFRTPLTLLMGPINDLLRNRENPAKLDSGLLASMKRNAIRLQALINQLLDLSRLETGNLKPEVSEGNFSGFVKTLASSFLSLAESRKINFSYEVEDRKESSYFDHDKTEKILSNLLSNALKFTPAEGCVRLSMNYVRKTNPSTAWFADIRIVDTGPGIPSGDLDKIFDRFYQASSSDTRKYEGSGIGLALVKEMAELLHGDIRVQSTPGNGSTFTVIIPVSREGYAEEEILEATKLPEIPSGDLSGITPADSGESPAEAEPVHVLNLGTVLERKKAIKTREAVILIVEDNRDLRNYLAQCLNSGYFILEAANGRSGLDRALENIPDLVVTDLMMPEMDGMELCRMLKTDQRTSHVPVIMLTARADRDSRLEGLETGADDYLVKPFDAEELQVRVRNLIDQRRKLRERYRKEFLLELPGHEIPAPEEDFLKRVTACIDKHLEEPEFNVEQLGKEIGLSRMQLYRKIVALTDHTPTELIRNIRLKLAARMFREGHPNITRVMYSVGFNSPSYFAQNFKKLFGVNPSLYIKQIRQPK